MGAIPMGAITAGSAVRTAITGSTMGTAITRAAVRSAITGAAMGPAVAGTGMRSAITGSTVRPAITGAAVRSTITGAAMGTAITGSTLRPTITGTSLRSTVTGTTTHGRTLAATTVAVTTAIVTGTSIAATVVATIPGGAVATAITGASRITRSGGAGMILPGGPTPIAGFVGALSRGARSRLGFSGGLCRWRALSRSLLAAFRRMALTLFGDLVDALFHRRAAFTALQLGALQLGLIVRFLFRGRLGFDFGRFGLGSMVALDDADAQFGGGLRFGLALWRRFALLTLAGLDRRFLISVDDCQLELTQFCAHGVEGMLVKDRRVRRNRDSRRTEYFHHLLWGARILLRNLVHPYCH